MKRFYVAVLFVFITGGFTPMFSQSPKYHVGINGGMRMDHDERYERYFKGDVTFGYYVWPQLRLDLTVGYAAPIKQQARYGDAWQIEILGTPVLWPDDRVIADFSFGIGCQLARDKPAGITEKTFYIPIKAYLGYYITERLGLALKVEFALLGNDFSSSDNIALSVLYRF